MDKAHMAFRRGLTGVAISVVFVLTLTPHPAFGKDYTVTITSTPLGAKVEIDGIEKGYTPVSFRVPPGYVKATHSVFSKKLGTPAHLRLSMPGYVSKEVDLAAGPFEWKNLYGVTMAHVYMLKATSFHFALEPVQAAASDTGTGPNESLPQPAPTPTPTNATQSGRSFAPSPTAPAPASPVVPDQPKANLPPLTNADIVRMVKAGIAEQTILLEIRKGPCQFDASPAALIELKAQGVPESVMRAMIRGSISDSTDAAQSAPQPQ